jgi:hypothetical protein
VPDLGQVAAAADLVPALVAYSLVLPYWS